MAKIEVKDEIQKIINIFSQSDFSVILKFVFFIVLGLFMAWLKRSAKKIKIKESRDEEATSKVETEVAQTQESGKVNEEVKTDGKAADIFLGE